MATKRTKKQLASTIDALTAYATYHKATSREGYYVTLGVKSAMKIVSNLMQGKYDHSLYAVEGGWVETDEQFDAAMVKMLVTDADATLRAGRKMEPLHRRAWTEVDE